MTQGTKNEKQTYSKIYKNGFVCFLKKVLTNSLYSLLCRKSSDSQLPDAPVSSIIKTITFCFCYRQAGFLQTLDLDWCGVTVRASDWTSFGIEGCI